jgi:hypothetical protein
MESINHKVRLTDIIAPSSIRVIAGTMLPGTVGAWPYLALAYGKFPWIESVMKGWPWAAVAAIILLAYGAGLVFSCLGAGLEEMLYERLKLEKGTAADERWEYYLLQDTQARPIFHKYYGLHMTWLSFSRATTFAIPALVLGTTWHAACWKSFSATEVIHSWIVAILAVYCMYRSTKTSVWEMDHLREILCKHDLHPIYPMKNKNDITAQLESTKKFVKKHARDTNPHTEEEIQSLLSQAIENTKDDDLDGLQQTLDNIDSIKVNGWDLTASVRLLLRG